MTPDEVERSMEFLRQQQIRFSARVRIRDRQIRVLFSKIRAMVKSQKAVHQISEPVRSQLAESKKRLDHSIAEASAKVQRVCKHIDAFILFVQKRIDEQNSRHQ